MLIWNILSTDPMAWTNAYLPHSGNKKQVTKVSYQYTIFIRIENWSSALRVYFVGYKYWSTGQEVMRL